MCCYAILATLCSAALATLPLLLCVVMRHSQPCVRRHSPHYPSFYVLLCGTRNPVFGGTRHTTPTLLIHVLLSGTRGTVLGGTRHTTYSCVVKRYSRHCVRRHSPHHSHLLLPIVLLSLTFLLGGVHIGASTPRWMDQCLRMGAFFIATTSTLRCCRQP